MRLFAANGWTLLAASAPFQVWPTVGGQITASGSPLLGVTFAATNGASCGPSESWGYGCLVPYGWSGTITPSKPGHIFSPALRSHTNITNHTSASFTTAPAHTVSGTISAGGSALSGVAMATSSGQASCTSTNGSGQYTCAIAAGWTGTVTPSLTDHVFTPASRSYTNVTGSHSAQTYTAQAFYQLGGTVTLNGSPLAGVALAATNGVACSNSNSSGQYSCTVPSGWSGSVTPALGIYNFTPASRSYSSVTTHQTTQGYATATYQVSGTVTAGGSPVVGATINATNGVTCSPTNTAGQYSCTVHSGWSGSVAPILSGHIFTPASRAYTSIASNATTDDYAAAVLSGPSQVFFIHADHLDTPRLVSNAAGTAVWRWDQQEPFGVNVPDENPSSLGAYEFPLRFPGQYFDKETNLHYNYFRDYDPANGRYAQSDPIGLDGGVNTYAYVDSGPLVLFDPEGLTPPRVVPRTTPRVPQAVTEKWRNTPQEKIPRNQITKPKDDIPSWAKGERPTNAETPKDFAKRVMDKRYGSDNYHTRGKGEYSQIKKYAETHFRPTSKPIVNEFVPFEWWDPFWEPWRGNPAEQWGPSCLI